MDSVTHVLTGAVLSRTRLGTGWSRAGAYALVLGSIVPDLDFIPLAFMGPGQGLAHHRGLLNSVFGIPPVALLLAWGLRRYFLRKGEDASLKAVFGLALLAMSMHTFMDLITSYGTMLLYPFSFKRFSLDLLFIIDPCLTVPLILALIVPFVFKGGTKKRLKGALGTGAVVFMAAYLVFAVVNHLRASSAAKGALSGVEQTRLKVYPGPFTPLNWMAVAEDEDAFYLLRDVLSTGGQGAERHEKLGDETILKAARGDYLFDTFMWFADFPHATSRADGEDTVVEITDLRFSAVPGRRAFVLTVRLGPDRGLKGVSFSH